MTSDPDFRDEFEFRATRNMTTLSLQDIIEFGLSEFRKHCPRVSNYVPGFVNFNDYTPDIRAACAAATLEIIILSPRLKPGVVGTPTSKNTPKNAITGVEIATLTKLLARGRNDFIKFTESECEAINRAIHAGNNALMRQQAEEEIRLG